MREDHLDKPCLQICRNSLTKNEPHADENDRLSMDTLMIRGTAWEFVLKSMRISSFHFAILCLFQ